MECQYCKNVFKNNASLKTHQKNAKYCIELQDSEKVSLFNCESCDKKFGKLANLKQHLNVCKKKSNDIAIELENIKKELDKYKILYEKSEQQNEKLEQTIKELQDKLENIAVKAVSRSTTTHNTVTNLNLGIFDKSAEEIKRIVDEKYDRSYLIQGQKGVAVFTQKHVLTTVDGKTPIYIITDRSRGNGKYKISDDEVVTDNGMIGLTKKVHPSIKSKAVFITSTHPNPLEDEELMAGYHEVFEMDLDNSVFRNCLVKEIAGDKV